MAKVIRCRDVGFDCDHSIRAETEEEALQQAAEHAKEVHGLEEVTPERGEGKEDVPSCAAEHEKTPIELAHAVRYRAAFQKRRIQEMKHKAFLFGTTLIVLLLFLSNGAAAQDLEAGDVLPELAEEERAQRAMDNFTAMTLVFLSYAKEHGEGAAELGRRAGERFADSWPEELTPAYFVRGMHDNFQMYGVTTEILEVSDSTVRAQRTPLTLGEGFESREEIYGVPLDEFETFFEHVQKGIAAERGLTYSESVEGDHVVFTVSASR